MQDCHRPGFYPVPGAALLVLFVHGFLGGPGLFQGLVQAVNEAGFAAETLLLPGHGKSAWNFARHTMREWQEEVNAALKRRLLQYEKVVLMGHSMGGLLSVNAFLQEGPAHGLVLWEAPLRLRATLNGLGNDLAVALLPKRFHGAVAKAYCQAANVRFYTPAGYLLTLPRTPDLFRLMARTRRELQRVRGPVLLIQSDADEIVHPGSLSRLLTGFSNAEVTTLRLAASWHAYVPAGEQALLQKRLVSWLETL